ncbi:MAG: hypothetical protein AcusKO_03750 [Acuticoccus sp.]
MTVFSVDAGDPFLKTLAARLADGTLWPGGARPEGPLALSRATIYLPTRRAVRALADEFLALAGGPVALPRIEALGESEEDGETGVAVVGRLEARVALAGLVETFARTLENNFDDDQRLLMPSSGADAVRLADALFTLMDQVETQEADWADLPGLVDRADLAAHWAITTHFLTIATEMWPRHLAGEGKISAATARRQEAERAVARMAAARGPVIVAGSTGSLPATRRLMDAVARSALGAVVLPGFDRAATTAAWDALDTAEDGPGHPQFGLHFLLRHLDVAPEAVIRLAPPDEAPLAPAPAPEWSDLPLFSANAPAAPATSPPSPQRGEIAARRRVLAAALRPAPDTHRWLADRERCDIASALACATLIDAPDERAEAAAVAVAMRGAVEKGERVALITPHRPLARRVSLALRRWDIEVDDSAGDALDATDVGLLARLVAAVAAGGGAADWLALAKHPLFALAPERAAVFAMEKVFRGPRIAPEAIPAELAAGGEPAAGLGRTISDALAPLTALCRARARICDLAAAQAAALAATLGDSDERPDLKAMVAALSELATPLPAAIDGSDWPATFDSLISGVVVRGAHEDAAVRILGPLEARLQHFDHVVLGGLNEGVWPAAADAGPWMSRGMMSAFGIELPERLIGLAAHDVFIAAHAPCVTLSRAGKAAGEPTVASRWWQRILAFCGAEAEPALIRGADLLAFAERLETRPSVAPAERPEPRPPVAARPTRVAITDVGRLVRDPYAYYARRILHLRPLDPLEAEPHGGDRGELIHNVLNDFIGEGHHLGPDPLAAFRVAARYLGKLALLSRRAGAVGRAPRPHRARHRPHRARARRHVASRRRNRAECRGRNRRRRPLRPHRPYRHPCRRRHRGDRLQERPGPLRQGGRRAAGAAASPVGRAGAPRRARHSRRRADPRPHLRQGRQRARAGRLAGRRGPQDPHRPRRPHRGGAVLFPRPDGPASGPRHRLPLARPHRLPARTHRRLRPPRPRRGMAGLR